MLITLNGKEEKINTPLNLHGLIAQRCKDIPHVIAEVNGDIVKRPNWEKTALQPGDAVELVNIVGGG